MPLFNQQKGLTVKVKLHFTKYNCLSVNQSVSQSEHIYRINTLDFVAVDHWSDGDSSSTDLKLSNTGPGPTGPP